MSLPTFQRILSIKAAAAGPYVIIGLCHDCGTEQPLVNFPRPLQLAIAVCRQCRFSRTGIEDRRGLIRASATVDRPFDPSTPVPVRGLLPPGPPVSLPRPPVLTEYSMSTVDEILAPWGSNPGETDGILTKNEGTESAIEAATLAELTDIDRQLDEILEALRKMEARG